MGNKLCKNADAIAVVMANTDTPQKASDRDVVGCDDTLTPMTVSVSPGEEVVSSMDSPMVANKSSTSADDDGSGSNTDASDSYQSVAKSLNFNDSSNLMSRSNSRLRSSTKDEDDASKNSKDMTKSALEDANQDEKPNEDKSLNVTLSRSNSRSRSNTKDEDDASKNSKDMTKSALKDANEDEKPNEDEDSKKKVNLIESEGSFEMVRVKTFFWNVWNGGDTAADTDNKGQGDDGMLLQNDQHDEGITNESSPLNDQDSENGLSQEKKASNDVKLNHDEQSQIHEQGDSPEETTIVDTTTAAAVAATADPGEDDITQPQALSHTKSSLKNQTEKDEQGQKEEESDDGIGNKTTFSTTPVASNKNAKLPPFNEEDTKDESEDVVQPLPMKRNKSVSVKEGNDSYEVVRTLTINAQNSHAQQGTEEEDDVTSNVAKKPECGGDIEMELEKVTIARFADGSYAMLDGVGSPISV